ncbi:hypothetical protein EMIHUDRAFT_442329 [Emiliania huxleyi CCMP1516]|uniref:Uncharacterized protein n=2 Tax=Emiliania huxleyi TaxID=2903 RepID=A0A0D3K557_EMIH1|nr:hypothetical protein EMIHUDRAFT_442329 [Emiliania huxleyi CCMP1516]EOD30892.1 hypothetical protein EMIHUDRAFT_442329 [Emiliania huxleyi CCMP1516]|eukprot:XP_005783321.1 hypothetical protein EMIHUDRAFT_442329 [Emiliania huxleyi CCMP1516]
MLCASSTASDPNDAEMTEVAWTAEPQWAPSRSGHPAAPPPTPFAASATRQPWLKVPLQSWSQPRPTPQPSSPPSATRARASFCSPELLGAMTALGLQRSEPSMLGRGWSTVVTEDGQMCAQHVSGELSWQDHPESHPL